jgi:hypothetical protein
MLSPTNLFAAIGVVAALWITQAIAADLPLPSDDERIPFRYRACFSWRR